MDVTDLSWDCKVKEIYQNLLVKVSNFQITKSYEYLHISLRLRLFKYFVEKEGEGIHTSVLNPTLKYQDVSNSTMKFKYV